MPRKRQQTRQYPVNSASRSILLKTSSRRSQRPRYLSWSVRRPWTRALQRLQRQGRKNGLGAVQKSSRSSITLLVRPPTCPKPQRRLQPPTCRSLTSLHRLRAHAESSVAMSFAMNGVREKAGSAGLKRDENVARKHLCLGPRRRSVARGSAAMFVWLSAPWAPRQKAYRSAARRCCRYIREPRGCRRQLHNWWPPPLQEGSGEISDPHNR
jgi:hypothetical protein